MTKGFWIWKNRLPEVLESISSKADIELKEAKLDEIKYGLIGTSEKKDQWFEYQMGAVALRLSIDDNDGDIILFQVTGLDDNEIDQLDALGTNLN